MVTEGTFRRPKVSLAYLVKLLAIILEGTLDLDGMGAMVRISIQRVINLNPAAGVAAHPLLSPVQAAQTIIMSTTPWLVPQAEQAHPL